MTLGQVALLTAFLFVTAFALAVYAIYTNIQIERKRQLTDATYEALTALCKSMLNKQSDGTMAGLTRAAYANSYAKGFWDSEGNRDLYRKLMLMVSELAEAMECLREGHDPLHIWYREQDGKPEGFRMELADTVIRIMDVYGSLGADLEADVREKMMFNMGRPPMHGKKA